MLPNESDVRRLQQALTLAEEAIGVSDPNPRVGCVIATPQGQLLGCGSTQQAGGPHAEVMALRAAQAAGHDVRGATAWVTLEPCAHHGRTPPCCDALIAAGVGRVVVAVVDPFPQVAGAGVARLRAAGMAVDVIEGPLADAAVALNIGFFSRVIRGRPWVRMKVAATLDGRTALADGRSQWITGPIARADGHAWRKRAAAVLTGIGTVATDDPRLDVRLVPTQIQPLRVVVDSHLRISPDARLLAPPGRVLIVTANGSDEASERLAAQGAELLRLADDAGRVDLQALMTELGRRGVNELHVEAGERLNAALLEADLVDEWLIYLAPFLMGPGRSMAALPALAGLDEAARSSFIDCTPCGADLRIRAQPADRLDFLRDAAAELPPLFEG